jgi:hypothetical protein
MGDLLLAFVTLSAQSRGGRVSGMPLVDKGRPSNCFEGGAAVRTDRSHDDPPDFRILLRIVSACTLGLWAFAGGLLIGVFLFS